MYSCICASIHSYHCSLKSQNTARDTNYLTTVATHVKEWLTQQFLPQVPDNPMTRPPITQLHCRGKTTLTSEAFPMTVGLFQGSLWCHLTTEHYSVWRNKRTKKVFLSTYCIKTFHPFYFIFSVANCIVFQQYAWKTARLNARLTP